MKKFYHSFLIAFSMYSKIPMPQCEWNEENMAYAMCFFPWVGVAIGGVTWLWGTFGARLGLSAAFYTVILTLIPWLITGWNSPGRTVGYGRRDEFLAGAGSPAGDPERFEFRSVCGDYLCGLLSCSIMAYTARSVPGRLAMIPFTFCLSRTLSGLAVVTFPKAKKTGSVSAMARGAKDQSR